MPAVFDPSSLRWSWIALSGPDAQDFLHRISSVNTREMRVGQGAKGCLLTPQGRIEAPFAAWNYREHEYGFEFDAGKDNHWKTALLSAIERYTFAEQISVTDVNALRCRWLFLDPGESAPLGLRAGETQADESEVRFCHHGTLDFGREWITVWGLPEKLVRWTGSLSWETLNLWRIEATRPWADHELTDSVMPLEAGFADAIAPNKGCYPGQEVIEKIIALGAPPRRLVLIHGTGDAPTLDEKITNESGTELGLLTSVASTTHGFSALGLVKKIHAKEELPVKLGRSIGKIMKVAPYA